MIGRPTWRFFGAVLATGALVTRALKESPSYGLVRCGSLERRTPGFIKSDSVSRAFFLALNRKE